MDTTGIRFIEDLNLGHQEEATVLIRADLNVPLKDGEVADDTRIAAAIPTISHAIEAGLKVIVCSHLGRPSGKVNPDLSLEPVAVKLAELIDTDTLHYDMEVVLPENVVGEEVDVLLEELNPNRQIMLLENLRFHPGEKAGDEEFAQKLASYADFYINDAFGAAHRKHASVYTINQYFDRHHKAAGYLVEEEIKHLSKVVNDPKKPFVAIAGGAKISDKLEVIESLLERVDTLLIGGAMAYTFLAAQGQEVGESLVEKDFLDEAARLLDRVDLQKLDMRLPEDHRVGKGLDATEATVTRGQDIPAGMMGLDIGPRTEANFVEAIAGAKTVFWNGPMGVFENEVFATGTMGVARAMAEAPGYTVVGGGDSASAVVKAEVSDKINHVSTGGGASLQLVQGKSLPGLEALRPNHPF